jgi:hypothetical protein
MRQSSREGDSSESGRGRGRRYSTTLSSSSAPVSTVASFTTTTSAASLQDQQQLLYSDSGAARSAAVALRSFSLGDSFVPHGAAVTSSSGSLLLVPANAASGTGAVLPGGAPPTGTLLVAVPPPPRSDSNMPLNLADGGRKRKSPEQPNALADAQSVREVWLNSQKKPANIRYAVYSFRENIPPSTGQAFPML